MLTQIVLISLLRAQSGLQDHAWEVPGIEAEDNTPVVFLVSAKQRRECPKLGSICLSPGGSATSEGVEVREDAFPLTVLARGAQVAAVGALQKPDRDQPWQVEMVADHRSRDGWRKPRGHRRSSGPGSLGCEHAARQEPGHAVLAFS